MLKASYIFVHSKQYPIKVLWFVMKLVLQGDLHALSAKDHRNLVYMARPSTQAVYIVWRS